ncbi:MAG: peroxide stress protein YaaA [Mycobacteriaceae bacterium]
MLILLPPSETKSVGGKGATLELSRLSFPELNPIRAMLVENLIELSQNSQASASVLGLGPKQLDEVIKNQTLCSSPTCYAIERYTGVLYDALNYQGMSRAYKAKALKKLAIGSALFGVIKANDLIPAYRLSAASKLPGLGTLASLWKTALTQTLNATADGLIVDLRSGSYQSLGPVPGAITAVVLTEHHDGSRTVVSHFNKHHKGLLARALVTTRAEPCNISDLAKIAIKAGLRAEVASPSELVILTD